MIKIFHNLHLKTLSLLSAIILWFFVVGIENTVYSFPETIEIQPRGIDKNVSLASALPSVKLYLRVDKELLKTLTKNDFEVTVNLSEVTPGEHQLPVSVLSKNGQISVLKVEPSEVNVKIAPLSEKEVSVSINFLGSPKRGYAVKEIKTEIEKVKILGAQSVIDKIPNVKAELVFDGSETEDVKQNVLLQIPEFPDIPKGSVIVVPEQIALSAVIIAETEQKMVPIKPGITGAADPHSFMEKIVIDPSTITIQGEERYLKTISSLETKPVDAQELIKGTAPLNLELILPENVSLLNPNQNVTVALKGESNERKNLLASIVFTKENSNFRVKKVTPSAITVVVMGPGSIIKNLKNEDVTVNINLENVSGSGALLINTQDIILPVGLEIVNFEPTRVELETTEV